jgi:hypothetical protein
MCKSKGYNGHKNWNHWNVSLWINNDEGLYNLAKACIRNNPKDRAEAAWEMCANLRGNGITKTPDGAPYSVSSIRAAMVGM